MERLYLGSAELIVLVGNLLLIGLWTILFRRHLRPSSNNRLGKLYLVIVIVQLLLIVLKAPLISDAVQYELVAASGDYSGWEPGFSLYSSFVWSIWPNGKGLVFCTSAFYTIIYAIIAWKYSSNVAFSMFFYVAFGFWGMSFFILRQTMAMAFTLIAFCCVAEKRPVPFLFAIATAASFHISSVFFLALYPVSVARKGILPHVAFLLIAILMLLLVGEIATVLGQNSRAQYSTTGLSGLGYLAMMVVMSIMVAVLDGRQCNTPSMYSTEVGILLQVTALKLSIMNRATRYFSIAYGFLIPNAIEGVPDKVSRAIYWVIVVCALTAFYFYTGFGVPGGADVFVFAPSKLG